MDENMAGVREKVIAKEKERFNSFELRFMYRKFNSFVPSRCSRTLNIIVESNPRYSRNKFIIFTIGSELKDDSIC